MYRTIAIIALVLSSSTGALAQIAPPQGAVSHTGSKPPMHTKSKPKMHSMKGMKSMSGMKATPKPKS